MELNLPTGRRGHLLALAITLTGLAVIYLAVVAPIIGFYDDRAQRLEDRRVLAQRMAARAADLPRLQARAASASQAAPPTFLIDGASDALAAANLQNQVQRMAGQAGITLATAESLPAEALGAYRRVGLKVSLSAPWPVLVNLVREIETSAPPMLIDDLAIHASPVPPGAGGQLLEASLTIYAFRAGAAS